MIDYECFNLFNSIIRERQYSAPAVQKQTNKQSEPLTKDNKLEETANKYSGELMILCQKYPELAKAIENKVPYKLTVSLKDIFELLPRSKRSVDRYAGLKSFLGAIDIGLNIISTRPASGRK